MHRTGKRPFVTTSFGVLVVLIVGFALANAESVLERAKRDAIETVKQGDAIMALAYKKARETLPEFLALVRTPRPTITGFALKVAFPYGTGTDAEFFWVSPFKERDDGFIGRINNEPRRVKSVKNGQIVAFDRDNVVDWLYHEDGRMVGNFTACALIKRDPPAQQQAFLKQYGLSCDF